MHSLPSRLDQLVVKPATELGGYGIVIGPKASEAELEVVAAQITADPRAFIAQEVVDLSTHPTWTEPGSGPPHRPTTVRAPGPAWRSLPGGLTRGRSGKAASS